MPSCLEGPLYLNKKTLFSSGSIKYELLAYCVQRREKRTSEWTRERERKLCALPEVILLLFLNALWEQCHSAWQLVNVTTLFLKIPWCFALALSLPHTLGRPHKSTTMNTHWPRALLIDMWKLNGIVQQCLKRGLSHNHISSMNTDVP